MAFLGYVDEKGVEVPQNGLHTIETVWKEQTWSFLVLKNN